MTVVFLSALAIALVYLFYVLLAPEKPRQEQLAAAKS